jgi:hypothetical protein
VLFLFTKFTDNSIEKSNGIFLAELNSGWAGAFALTNPLDFRVRGMHERPAKVAAESATAWGGRGIAYWLLA